jgi:phospholipase C
MRRRRLLQGLGGAAGAVAVGCGSDETRTPAAPGGGGTGPGAGGQGGAPTTVTTSSAGGGGSGGMGGAGGGEPTSSCDDALGMSPEELLAPIEHVVVLCLENRSFDHYLGGSLRLEEGRMDVVGLAGTEANPHPQNGPVSVYAMDELEPDDPPHQWDAVHDQWNLGMMDGFVQAALDAGGSNPEEVMGYYVRDQLPIHHALADTYAVCNAYHCSVLAGTWPNRFYLHGATSNGVEENVPILNGFDSIWPVLKDDGLTVRNYYGDVPWAVGAYLKTGDLELYNAFEMDAASGNLPNFSIIDPRFFGAGANDDHPANANVALAQALISDVYTTLALSPAWDKCLLVVTYDEHGGFFDHVAPPISGDDQVEFNHMGVRVPALVAGPYVRQGCAIDTVLDHVAILKTLSTRWGIAPLNTRMSASNDLSSFIDPLRVQNQEPSPPVALPMLTIYQSELRAHAERLDRGLVAPQHPELIDALRQHGILKTVRRHMNADATLAHYFDRARAKGVLRLL